MDFSIIQGFLIVFAVVVVGTLCIVTLVVNKDRNLEKNNIGKFSSNEDKNINIENMSYYKAYELMAEYFFDVGLIKKRIPNLDKHINRQNFDIEFVYPLAKRIFSDYSSYAFKKRLTDYHFHVHFKEKFDDLFIEMKHIYNEIKEYEEFFRIVFKNEVTTHEFQAYLNKSSVKVEQYASTLNSLRRKYSISEEDLTVLDDYIINDDPRKPKLVFKPITKEVEKVEEVSPVQVQESVVSTISDPTIEIIKKYT